MSSAVENRLVGDKTPLSLTTRIVDDCNAVIPAGFTWVFVFNNGEKLRLFRIGDSLCQYLHDNPLLQPMLWWLKPFGWPAAAPLSIVGLLEAIDQRRFWAQMHDCCLHGPQSQPTPSCQDVVRRLDQLTQVIERAEASLPQIWRI